MITGVYAGIAGLMLIYFSIRVIRIRRRDKVSIGAGGNAALERAVRVHGNFVEYTPLTLILIFVVEGMGLPAVGVHALGASLILARIVHFLGFRSPEAPPVLRVGGMMLTFLLLLVLSIMAIVMGMGLAGAS